MKPLGPSISEILPGVAPWWPARDTGYFSPNWGGTGGGGVKKRVKNRNFQNISKLMGIQRKHLGTKNEALGALYLWDFTRGRPVAASPRYGPF